MTKERITIRRGQKADLNQVFDLICELAIYEKEPDSVRITANTLEQDFDTYRLLVATSDERIVGMALYFPYYSTWEGKCLYLEDLIVTESYRRNGIGTLLWKALVKEARDMDAARLMWQVLDWNADAISFYENMNSRMDNSWVNCRLTREQLRNFEL